MQLRRFTASLVISFLSVGTLTISDLAQANDSSQVDEQQFLAPQKKLSLQFKGLRLSNISEYPNQGLTAKRIREEVNDVISAYNGKLSLDSLRDIASRITTLYRRAGFVFTRAYIPEQKSRDGSIEIRLLEGYLADVDVYNNQYFDQAIIARTFKDLEGKIIYSPDIEEAMALANDIPGLNVFGFFSIGEEVGSTRINLRTREEKHWSAVMRADNHGSPLTGENRLFAIGERFNLSGHGDVLRLSVLKTFSPTNSTYGAIDYQIPVWDKYTTLRSSLSYNDFLLGRGTGSETAALKLSGNARSATVTINRYLTRSNSHNNRLDLIFRDDVSESNSKLFPELIDTHQHSQGLGLNWAIDRNNRVSHSWYAIDTEINAGRFLSGNPGGQGKNYSLIRGNASYGLNFNLPALGGSNNVDFMLSWQLSQDIVPATELFALSGAQKLLAFEPGEFSADSGAIFRAQWYFPLPKWLGTLTTGESIWSPRFNTFLVLHQAYGKQNQSVHGLNDETANMGDFGAGINFVWQKNLSAQLTIAKPTHFDISYRQDEVDDIHAYFQLIWQIE